MAGFLSATLINSSIDAALGYGATELGPHWRKRRPVAINRRQTLLVKWALPGFFGTVAHVEPLRQLLLGTRATLYFDARGDAGLTHSLILIACEFAFWALVGLAVTSWYDHKRLYRISPDLFSSISRAIDQTVQQRSAGDPTPGAVAGSDATQGA